MDYKKLYTLSSKFDEALKSYVIKKDEGNDSFYVANVLLSGLADKSYKLTELRNEFGKYLRHGGTIRLKVFYNTQLTTILI